MVAKIIEKTKNESYVSSNTSEIGVQFEEKVADLYRKLGYRVSFTPSSGDYGVDLIAESNNMRIGIQCKNHGGNIGVDAVMQANSGALYYDCKNSVVAAPVGFTKRAYEMAGKLNVELLIIN